MSDTSICYIRENSENIPYIKYFEFFPCERWSLQHYVSIIINDYEHAEKMKSYHAFYNTLHAISNNNSISEEIRNIAQNILKNKKAEDIVESPPKKRQCTITSAHFFFPEVNVPLRADESLDILKMLKLAVCTFDQNAITLGSTRSYKSSNYLRVETKCNEKVPKESIYDAEMYRILMNWLAKDHDFEITGQWHLKQVCEDGDWHDLYSDLTIKRSADPNPVALLELIATGSIPKLKKHFEQIFKYANQLCPQEVWVVHFSREDSVVLDPYWPSDELQGRGLNVVHFWHDKEFKNVRMSSRFRDATGKFQDIIDEQILP
ncbi:15242_t:CDS:2 [Racocetra persica]|uniref:15242_t:CDS:1 n=1 Tax=Racocetra persica TaxID=160502 RepID=A0ACA9QDD8_9GLOM|nr:15242_t:CDS:2 [Racocetra persica]